MSSSQITNSGTRHIQNSISSPSILKVCGRQSLNNVPFRKVRFNLFNNRVVNIKQMLINYDQNNDKEKTSFNNFICDIRDSTSDIIVSIKHNYSRGIKNIHIFYVYLKTVPTVKIKYNN